MRMVDLVRITSIDDYDRCQKLFEEYTTWVVGQLRDRYRMDVDPHPHHEAFRAEFPKLAGARGRLYVAEVDGEAAGVGALKPMSDEVGEIKRMYVRPGSRRNGVARTVLDRLIVDAKAIGYRRLLLETATFMTAAHPLYRSLGFVDCAPYADSEAAAAGMSDVVFFMEAQIA